MYLIERNNPRQHFKAIQRPVAGAEAEGAELNQEDAKREIIREWRSLPKEQRQTDEQAAHFAMLIKDKYKFRGGSANPYQTIKGWLQRHLSLTRGLD